MSEPPIALEADILIEEPDWLAVLPEAAAIAHKAATAAFMLPQVANIVRSGTAEVSVLLTNDFRIQALNRTYRQFDHPTNVLAFPQEIAADPESDNEADGFPPCLLLGDVVIALETTRREAAEAGKLISAHLSHLVVHGMLHLLGYDHDNDADADIMENLERLTLASLGVADPYAENGVIDQ